MLDVAPHGDIQCKPERKGGHDGQSGTDDLGH
jgi:hypothetical protein